MPDASSEFVAYPVFRWPTSGWWFTIVGGIVAVCLFIIPGITQSKLTVRILLAIALVALPGLFVFAKHKLWRYRATKARSEAYSEIWNKIQDAEQSLANANKLIHQLILERQDRRSLRISHCYFLEETFIALNRKRGFRVEVGMTFVVVDTAKGLHLGEFEITDSEGEHYVGKLAGFIEPLWLGYIKNGGATKTQPPIGARAFFLSNEEGADE